MTQPALDYTSKDFVSFRTSMLDYATQTMPEWQSRSEGDFGVVLVELMAYMGDILSYYGDRIQTEAYLSTATQRLSLLQIADLLGYVPSNGVPAVGTVTLVTNNPGPAVLVPAGTKVQTGYLAVIDGSITYETDDDVTVPANGATAAVSVTHGITTSLENVGTSTGLAAQSFRLGGLPVIANSIQVFVDAVNSDGTTTQTEWAQVDYLVDSDPGDLVFSTYTDESGASWVSFGDGLNGAIPNINLTVYATYRVGGGQVGNITAGQIQSMGTTLDNKQLDGVDISVDANGIPMTSIMSNGSDPETNDQIRANAPRAFRTQGRAVTLQDFIDIALAVPGVLRANALASTFTSVTIFAVGPDGGAPSTTLSASISDALLSKSLAGTSVTVSPPTFIGVNVGSSGTPLTIQVLPHYKRATVLAAVQTAIKTQLSFVNVDFGMHLTVSDFYSTIMGVAGVQWVAIPLLVRADAAQTGTADLVFRQWEIPKAGSINVIANGGVA